MPRKVAIGVVTGGQMAKTRRVEIPRLVKHPKYGKYVKRKSSFGVHDEHNAANLGDLVEVVQCRPYSKNKSWRLVKIVKQAVQQED